MGDPWLSIVMPVWNGERYVGEALQSVREQGGDGYELIAVDDGSTDGSPGILRSWERLLPLRRPGRIALVHRRLGPLAPACRPGPYPVPAVGFRRLPRPCRLADGGAKRRRRTAASTGDRPRPTPGKCGPGSMAGGALLRR